ncbi:MAG: hypothetical protein JST00_12015 [Deltaproteobacteria bacterium]|nr:hypothetical protein [Deltaproteobacteria bacterium]
MPTTPIPPRILSALPWCAAIFLLPLSSHAQQSTAIVVETVSDYSYAYGTHAKDIDSNIEGQGLWDALTSPGTPWTPGAFWQDADVWDTDFYDRELTGYYFDRGDDYFDAPGTGISFLMGHGLCDDVGSLNVSCWSDADCPAGSYCPGGTPLPSTRARRCIQQKWRVVHTSSPNSMHLNQVGYGQTYGQPEVKSFAMGEDDASGGFAGVGTNGGANVTILVNSCGFRSRYIANETKYFMAGTHVLLGMAATNAVNRFPTVSNVYSFSDTATWPARGATLGNLILTNIYAAMADAWLTPSMTMQNVAFTHANTFKVATEGAHILVSRDASQALADWHANSESWLGSTFESNDPVGNTFGRFRWLCNYNCNVYGW